MIFSLTPPFLSSSPQSATVALAAALFREDLPDTVIAIGSGGNVDTAVFADSLARFGG